MIRLYNSLSGKKETFVPKDGKTAKIYNCGPTVYDFAHIGNLRTYIFEDILRRTIKQAGYKVLQVMNITDVEDKIIKKALISGKKINDITRPFEKAFFEDIEKLNIEIPEKTPRATEHVEDMIILIRKLLDRGFAYKDEDGSVYFNIVKYKDYGKLSKPDLKGANDGARVSSDEYEKDEAKDFVLWKARKDNEPYWESPFGRGRPGWHIECSAMSMKYLGETLDIHAGGIDNMFPHHENELAQSEASTGKTFSRFFIHGEHLLVEGARMSKSAGNFHTLRDIEKKGFSPLAFRYLCLQTHYRSKMNFSWEALAAAENGLNNLREAYALAKSSHDKRQMAIFGRDRRFLRRFRNAIEDDLGSPQALAVLWQAMKNDSLRPAEKASFADKADAVLGLDIGGFYAKSSELPKEVAFMIKNRDKARKEGKFSQADEIRVKIEAQGYEVKDEPKGTVVTPVLPVFSEKRGGNMKQTTD